jgi:hypothetical protein
MLTAPQIMPCGFFFLSATRALTLSHERLARTASDAENLPGCFAERIGAQQIGDFSTLSEPAGNAARRMFQNYVHGESRSDPNLPVE